MPIVTETYAHLQALCAEHGIEADVAASLLALRAFGKLDLDRLRFWAEVSEIVIANHRRFRDKERDAA